MKTVQPEMNVRRQIRKALGQIVDDLNAGYLDRAYYRMGLLNLMLDSIDAGQPKPWSEFELLEEFS